MRGHVPGIARGPIDFVAEAMVKMRGKRESVCVCPTAVFLASLISAFFLFILIA